MNVIAEKQLSELTDTIHDWWFDLDCISLDADRKVVAIHLEEKARHLAGGSPDGLDLLIRNAEALKIVDSEKVGRYDINDIRYVAQDRLVVVTTGIPVTIEVKVTSLNIEVVAANAARE